MNKDISPRVTSADFLKIESRYIPYLTNEKLANRNFFPGHTIFIALLPGLKSEYY